MCYPMVHCDKQEPLGTLWYLLKLCDTLCYTMVHCGTLWYPWYTEVPHGTVVPCDTLCYSVVHHGTLWYTMVYCGTLWYTVVHHLYCGTPWYPVVLNGT